MNRNDEIVSERHVQAIWYDAALRPANLRTADGAPIRVVDPGRWNLEAGPDFRDAVLEIGTGRRRFRGDVEVHVRAADWAAHGHGRDPAYADVVAHVTWHPGPPPVAGPGCPPPRCVRICLGDVLRTRPDFSPEEIDLAAYPYARLPATPRPCETSFAHAADAALALLRTAGERRLEGKARRLGALFVRNGDRAQTFYEEMMAAFGYKHNAAPFRALAQTLPWRELPSSPHAAATALACAAKLGVAPRVPWHTANVRPSNAPSRRIDEAAQLFAGALPGLLLRLDACDLATRPGQQAALDILCAARPLGARRAAAMLANVLIPFARAEGRLARVPGWIFPEDLNSTVRLTAFRLFGRDHNPALYAGNGLLVQGLLQVHREFCLAAHPDCSSCPLAPLGEAASRRFIPYGTPTLPATPSNPFAGDGAKYNGTSPANGSASAATSGTTTDWQVAL